MSFVVSPWKTVVCYFSKDFVTVDLYISIYAVYLQKTSETIVFYLWNTSIICTITYVWDSSHTNENSVIYLLTFMSPWSHKLLFLFFMDHNRRFSGFRTVHFIISFHFWVFCFHLQWYLMWSSWFCTDARLICYEYFNLFNGLQVHFKFQTKSSNEVKYLSFVNYLISEICMCLGFIGVSFRLQHISKVWGW